MTRLIEKYRGDATPANYLVLAVESADPFEAEALQAFSKAIEAADDLANVEIVMNPFEIVTFVKNGKKLDILPPPESPPDSDAEISRYRESLLTIAAASTARRMLAW